MNSYRLLSSFLAIFLSVLPAESEVLESVHASISFEAESAVAASTVAGFVDQIYGPIFIFFSQIGGMNPSPGKVPIQIMNDAELTAYQLAAIVTGGQEPLAMTNDDANFTIIIDPDLIGGLETLKTTITHELFHHLSYRSGVVDPSQLTDQDYWLVEGTAEVAEYYFSTPNTHKRARFEEYLFLSSRHQDVGLLDSEHFAALFVYYLWQQDQDSFRTLMSLYGSTKDGAAVASQMGLDMRWADFTKLMFNRDPISPISIEGSPLLAANGENLTPAFGADGRIFEVPSKGVVSTDVVLPPLSWQHAMLNIDGGLEWFNVVVGELADDPEFVVHAYLKKKGGDSYIYEDWSGKNIRMVCNVETGPCEGETLDDVQKIVLIMANTSQSVNMEGKLVAGGLAEKWKLAEMQVSQTLIVPALDELTLEFGTNGGMLVKSKGWWLKFPTSHFPGNTSALAYKWVNHACRFKGYVKFQRDMESETAEYEDVQARMKYTWKTSRVDKGGLINTPSGWWCDFKKELTAAGALGGLAGGAAVARVFTNLNT
ncbi:MAG: hypothetical protein K8F59_15890, partial [Rhodobacteraceae bacterium]|nr:hypothetical protein [Paracoccaceae bacterium]